MKGSKKLILLGNFGVGKSSLVKRFVHSMFSEEYLTTIGVKIDKKVVQINGQDLRLIIWDIAGESSQAKIPASYKLGAHGIIYVIDILRPSTYDNIESEIAGLNQLLPGVPILKIANKIDLVKESELQKILAVLPFKDFHVCSAKTGKNVEMAFMNIAQMLAK